MAQKIEQQRECIKIKKKNLKTFEPIGTKVNTSSYQSSKDPLVTAKFHLYNPNITYSTLNITSNVSQTICDEYISLVTMNCKYL